ncbi:efflux transporter, outer membrane factor lipoprotein, NodT family [Burkholderiales bacterium JOSHI_001]|nr:efflux transporter, outer membrane factor lipoprotein, NodT family [Burkholderiales bacterium JOSHI_001]
MGRTQAHRGVWLGLVSALLLSACALPHRAALPTQAAPAVAVPSHWVSAPTTGAADLSTWWRLFGDPLLAELVQDAQIHHTSVQQAVAALAQARAATALARAGSSATLDAGGSLGASRAGSAATGRSARLALDAAWEADLFGRQAAGVAAAKADERSSALALADVQVSVAAETGLAYLTLRGNQTRLAVARANLASQQDTEQITTWRQRAGLASVLEVDQARSAVDQTRATLPALQSAITQGAHALAVLTGRPPAELRSRLETPRPLPAVPETLALALPADTLRRRPDLRAAEADAQAAAARVVVAEGAARPSFRLSGSLGLSALSLGSLFNTDSLLRSLLASVNWPLLDGGAAQATVAARQAALDQVRARWEGSLLTALREVEDALTALQHDRERHRHLQSAADAAASAEQLARTRQSAGLVDLAVVLETQRTLLAAQSSLAGVATDIATDHVRLYKALGGGWTPQETSAALPASQKTP